MAIKLLPFHLGKSGACPCQSHGAGAEEKSLFPLCQEQTVGEKNMRGSMKKAVGKRLRLDWIKKEKEESNQTKP